MSRVKILYADGENSYGDLVTDRNPPCIVISGNEYGLDQFAKTGATVAVNDPESLKLLHEYGVKARPTPHQDKITISVKENLKERLVSAAKEDGTTVTGVLVSLAEQWLQKTGR